MRKFIRLIAFYQEERPGDGLVEAEMDRKLMDVYNLNTVWLSRQNVAICYKTTGL